MELELGSGSLSLLSLSDPPRSDPPDLGTTKRLKGMGIRLAEPGGGPAMTSQLFEPPTARPSTLMDGGASPGRRTVTAVTRSDLDDGGGAVESTSVLPDLPPTTRGGGGGTRRPGDGAAARATPTGASVGVAGARSVACGRRRRGVVVSVAARRPPTLEGGGRGWSASELLESSTGARRGRASEWPGRAVRASTGVRRVTPGGDGCRRVASVAPPLDPWASPSRVKRSELRLHTAPGPPGWRGNQSRPVPGSPAGVTCPGRTQPFLSSP